MLQPSGVLLSIWRHRSVTSVLVAKISSLIRYGPESTPIVMTVGDSARQAQLASTGIAPNLHTIQDERSKPSPLNRIRLRPRLSESAAAFALKETYSFTQTANALPAKELGYKTRTESAFSRITPSPQAHIVLGDVDQACFKCSRFFLQSNPSCPQKTTC